MGFMDIAKVASVAANAACNGCIKRSDNQLLFSALNPIPNSAKRSMTALIDSTNRLGGNIHLKGPVDISYLYQSTKQS